MAWVHYPRPRETRRIEHGEFVSAQTEIRSYRRPSEAYTALENSNDFIN